MNPVTDPDLLAQLNAPARPEVGATGRVWGDKEAEAAGLYEPQSTGRPYVRVGPRPVTDPALLAQLNGEPQSGAPIAERFGEFEQPQNAGALQSGLRDQAMAMTRGPAAPAGVQALNEFQNQAVAAGQRTTPNIRAQMANLVSDQVFESDAGTAVFRDPATGQLIEAQDNQHVVMRDPADNRLKVFNRTPETDEGALSAGGRLMGTGLAAGAVTRRPSIPTPSTPQVRASDIMQTAKPHYREFEKQASQIGVPAETGTGIADRIRGALDKRDLIPDLAPTVYKAIELLDGAQSKLNAGEKLTLDNLQRVKRVVGKSFNSPDKNVRDAAAIASAEISKVISEVAPSASNSLKTADEIQSTAYALQNLQRKGAVADLRTGRAGYGGNATNTLRQVISPIVQASVEGKKTGFQPNEIQALRELVEGTATINALRTVGQLSPTKGSVATLGGIIGGGSAGVMAAGPAGAGVAVALPALGAASNKLASVMTGSQFERIKELVAKRSPAYAEAVKKATERYERAQMEFVNNPSSNRLAAFVAASRQLSNGLTRDGINISSGELLRLMPGGMKSAAEEEQP